MSLFQILLVPPYCSADITPSQTNIVWACLSCKDHLLSAVSKKLRNLHLIRNHLANFNQTWLEYFFDKIFFQICEIYGFPCKTRVVVTTKRKNVWLLSLINLCWPLIMKCVAYHKNRSFSENPMHFKPLLLCIKIGSNCQQRSQ